MKKIYSYLTHSLLALLLGVTPLFLPSIHANQEAENLEAWAKMYEEMNQASGGEIEKLMKDMEQSGELDALMKELEQSGELNNIIDAMVKGTPQEFMQNLEQEMEKETTAQAPVRYPEPEPLVASKPSLPATPIMQVDKSKLKQVQALLSSIVSKIASIKQKAAINTSVQKELTPWEYNLTDLSYYLTTIQDEALAKYLQQPEFAGLYDHLVALNNSLSSNEPRFQIEDPLDIEFEDPYMILGFSSSNISKAEAEKKYTALAAQKNPFAIKDKLKKQGLSPAEIDAQFKLAQKEYNKIFDAYKRIEQKETSSQAFLAILQALHTAIYKDKVVEDAKRLLRQYDPEALKLKEAQEAKEKDARDYKARVASQRPEFIPPVFDWPSFGAGRDSDRDSSASKDTGYDWSGFDWGDDSGSYSGGKAPMAAADKGAGVGAQDKAKDKDKDKKDDKKGDKKADDKKDDKKDDSKKDKDGKPKKEEKPTADKNAAAIVTAINTLKTPLEKVSTAIDAFFHVAPVKGRDEALLSKNIDAAIPPLEKLTADINKDVELFKKEIDQAKDDTQKDAAKKELAKYYKTIEEAFDKTLFKDPANKDKRKKTIENLFIAIPDPKKPKLNITLGQTTAYFSPVIPADPKSPSRIEKLQKSYANLVYALTNTSPKPINDALVKANKLAKQYEGDLKAVISKKAVSQSDANIITRISKELTPVAENITKSKDKLKSSPIKDYHAREIKAIIEKQLPVAGDTMKILNPIATMQLPDPKLPAFRNPAAAIKVQDEKPIKEFQKAFNTIKAELNTSP